MRFECQQCHTAYSISDGRVRGKRLKIRCRNCGQMMEVRDPSSPELAAVSKPDQPTPSRASPSRPAEAAPPSSHGWYVGLDGSEEGPLSEAEIAERVRNGRISANHFVWREGLPDWVTILSVPELAGFFSRPPRPPPKVPEKRKSPTLPEQPAVDKIPADRGGAAKEAQGVEKAPAAEPPSAEAAADSERSRLELLERVHRKRQQARADRQADRIAEYFFQSTHLLGETASLPPPPVAGIEPLAQKLEQEAEQERTGEPADPLARLVKREESLEEISKVTKVLAEQARLGTRDAGRRLGVTLALVFGLVGMFSGFIALGVAKGWFTALGLNFLGSGPEEKVTEAEAEDLNLSPEESRRLREQLWSEKRKAAGGSALDPNLASRIPAAGAAQPSEREKQLLAFYQQEAERKREVLPRQPEDLLGMVAPAEISLPTLAEPQSLSPGEGKREITPEAPPPLANGELSEAQIKQVIDSHYLQLKKCLEHQLKRDARVSGKLLVTALVTPQGKVTKAWIPTQKFHGTFVEECLIKEVQRWEFPAFTGPPREVSFPLLLSPQSGG